MGARHRKNLCVGFVKNWSADWPEKWGIVWAGKWSVNPPPGWINDFAKCEFLSWGRAVRRSILARVQPETILERLFVNACQISLGKPSGHSDNSFESAIDECRLRESILFGYRSRNTCKRSSEEDRSLLSDRVQSIHKPESALDYGLKYLIRGDLILADGTEMAIDDICSAIGIPHLPYLEDIVAPPSEEVFRGKPAC